jgi:UDP-N-acetyl-D-mannosaminuronic acid dehydrogenase
MKICVIGLGEVGFATAKYILGKKLRLWGYDISQTAIDRSKKAGIANSTKVWEDIPQCDTYLICVSTGLKGRHPDLSQIFSACERIKTKLTPSAHPLVSIESTIVPTLCKRVFKDVFAGRVYLVHVPHRYWAEEPDEHGVKQCRVIGGVDANSLKAGIAFYKDALGIPLHVVSSVEIAETSKIAENAYRYVQIAFAEELRMICEKSGLSFDDLREACNTKWNTEIFEAREGIGGHCLPKDILYVISLANQNTLLKSALAVDAQYRKWLANNK